MVKIRLKYGDVTVQYEFFMSSAVGIIKTTYLYNYASIRAQSKFAQPPKKPHVKLSKCFLSGKLGHLVKCLAAATVAE